MLGGMVEESGKHVENVRVKVNLALKRVYRGCLHRVRALKACPRIVPLIPKVSKHRLSWQFFSSLGK